MGQNEPKLIYQIQNGIKRSKQDLIGLSGEVYSWIQFFQNVEVKVLLRRLFTKNCEKNNRFLKFLFLLNTTIL